MIEHRTTRSFRPSLEAEAAAQVIMETVPYIKSFSDAVNYALREAAQPKIESVSIEDLERVQALMRRFSTLGPSVASEVSAKPGRKPKPTDDEVLEIGRQICKALGGTEDGGTCLYKKYEVTPIGKAVSYEVGLPFTSLSDRDIETQYEPSRETWEGTYAQQST